MTTTEASPSRLGTASRPLADVRAWRWALAIVGASVLVRLCLAAIVPAFPDETYYWEWSRQLAAGYFDHPPAVAVLIAAGTAVGGPTVLGIRLGALVVSTVASLLLVTLGARIGNGASALRASVLLVCMPIAAGLVLATPDAPLFLSVVLTLAAVDRALCLPPGSRQEIAWWLLAGAAAGAGFVSKLTAVLIPVGITLALVARPDLRRRARAPGPWLAALVSLALFLPFVTWNSRNGWISFGFQLEHGLGAAGGSALLRELELLGAQMALASPVLFVLLAWACIAGIRDPDPRRFVPSVVALTTYGVFVVSVLRRSAEANWPAIAYVPAIVVLATAPWSRRVHRWFVTGAALGGVMVLATYLQGLVAWMPVDASADPIARAHGWHEIATVSQTESAGMQNEGCPTVWPAARTFQHASEVAFHLPGQPFVPSTNLASRANQYDFWDGFPELAAPGDCLVLFGSEPGTEAGIEEIKGVFGRVARGPVVSRTRAGRETEQIHFWRLYDWSGDPAPFR
jgi:4-amino-4-deoxy-L-arabinose transferase-like glycosyltransferase